MIPAPAIHRTNPTMSRIFSAPGGSCEVMEGMPWANTVGFGTVGSAVLGQDGQVLEHQRRPFRERRPARNASLLVWSSSCQSLQQRGDRP